MLQKQSPAVAGTTQPGEHCESQTHSTKPRRIEKWRRVLSVMMTGKRLTRFDAEKIGDHCLHSTVSYLEIRGVVVDRHAVVVPGRFGPVHCRRYWLRQTPENRAVAELLIEHGKVAFQLVRGGVQPQEVSVESS